MGGDKKEMKRLNPKTNKPFKMRDIREDGYIFDCYIKKLQKNGYFKEMWRSPEGFEKRMKRKSKRKREIYDQIKKECDQYKLERGCAHCGYKEHAVALDFHHINPEEKTIEVSRVWKTGWKQQEKLKKEIEKCIILCANCHRVEEERLRNV
jgi:5-methylcytosine-specific restriction endonuclease McrA